MPRVQMPENGGGAAAEKEIRRRIEALGPITFAEFMERNGKHYTASHSMNYGFNSAAFILHDMTGDAAGSSTQGEQVTLG